MLAIGVYAPSRDGFDLSPTICRKWIQSPYAIDHRRGKLVPTIVGEAVNLPDGAWEWLEDRLQRTEITRVTGRPRAAATDLPTWHLEIVTAASPHRVHAYGAGVSSVVYGNHEVDPGLRAVNLAIGTIEQFAGRIPWTERLELQAVKPTIEVADSTTRLDELKAWVEAVPVSSEAARRITDPRSIGLDGNRCSVCLEAGDSAWKHEWFAIGTDWQPTDPTYEALPSWVRELRDRLEAALG
jgi:hypothetical protein